MNRTLKRIDTAFRNRPALSTMALAYRVSEVGRGRIDFAELRVVISDLMAIGTIRRDPGGLMRHAHVDHEESAGTDHALECTAELARRRADAPIEAVSEALHMLGQPDLEKPRSYADNELEVADGSSIRWTTYTVECGPANARLSVMMDPTLLPLTLYDSSFWRHVIECAKRRVLPGLITRSVAVHVFPVARLIGARAVQYYGYPVAAEVPHYLTDMADHAGWPWLLKATPDGFARSAQILTNALPSWPGTLDAKVEQCISHAEDLRLHEQGHATPERIEDWARRSRLDLPPAWVSQLQRHQRSDGLDDETVTELEKLPRASGKSTASRKLPVSPEESPKERPAETGTLRPRRPAEIDSSLWRELRSRKQ